MKNTIAQLFLQELLAEKSSTRNNIAVPSIYGPSADDKGF